MAKAVDAGGGMIGPSSSGWVLISIAVGTFALLLTAALYPI
jgi:hypothetical protein